MRAVLSALAGCVLLVCSASGQEPSRGPDGGTSTRVSGVELLAIPGMPFFAKTATEWTRKLEDGSSITTRLEANLGRDGRGRLYRERHSFVPANSNERSPLNIIHLSDPRTRTQMFCMVRAMECQLLDFSPQTTFEDRSTGVNSTGTRSLTRESLGSDVIEGLYVTGTRETTTINAAVIGNEQPIISTREFWYSDRLKTNLLVIRDDPRTGRQVIRLSHIAVGEPDPHLFDVPIGYKIVDQRTAAVRARTTR